MSGTIDESMEVEPLASNATVSTPSRYRSNYVELKDVSLHEFKLFLKLLYGGQAEVIGDKKYAKIVSLLNTYDVEYKGRKLRERDSLRVLRAAGLLDRTVVGERIKGVYHLKLPKVGINYYPSKKNPLPHADVVFRLGGDGLRLSRSGSNYASVDPSEIAADKLYLASLRQTPTLPPSAGDKSKVFYAGHKAILCARCKYFNSMTIQDTFTIHFDDQMDKELFRIFLTFIYEGPGVDAPKKLQEQIIEASKRRREKKIKRGVKVADTHDTSAEEMSMLLTLLTVSGKYGLDDLKIQCEYLLLKKLDENNVFKVFQCACSSGANQLKQVCHFVKFPKLLSSTPSVCSCIPTSFIDTFLRRLGLCRSYCRTQLAPFNAYGSSR